MDVAERIESLPPPLRDICHRLKYESIAQVADDLDMPRTTFMRHIRKYYEGQVRMIICDK